MQQFFVLETLKIENEIKLNEDIAYQCLHVLRYQNGKIVRCVDQNGVVALCSIRIEKENVYAHVNEILKNDSEMRIKMTLVQALIRKERWEYLLQKATELGIYRIVPIELKRNIVRWDINDSKNKHDRYQKIMIEAAEQSKRSYIPKLESIIKINEIEKYKSEINLVAYENEDKTHLRNHIRKDISVTVICGPEGGFEESEINYLITKGFTSVSLGKRILRAETAGLYILSGIDFMFEGDEHE